jgi:carboxyl-terminal processing protease
VIAPTVEGKFFSDSRVGYISITSFAEPTASQYEQELAKLEQQPLKGLVIDLRSNPGGLLDTATEMLGRYLDNKLVVKMKFRDGKEVSESTERSMVSPASYPIAILMDENSASAAEIFAGCMQDYGKAVLVGTHSYGKASVQHVDGLLDGASAKITIAKYYLPRSGYIGRKVDEFGTFVSGGLEPDIKVELNLEADMLGDPKVDNQLARAIQYIQSKS